MSHHLSPTKVDAQSFTHLGMGARPKGTTGLTALGDALLTSTPLVPPILGRGRGMPFMGPVPPPSKMASGDQDSMRHMNVAPFVPKLPIFSGEDNAQKGDNVLYTEWRFEIKCLVSDPEVSEHLIIQAIRRSVKGIARKIMIPLGEKASVTDILYKFDAMFGDVSNKGMIMQEFFNAAQKTDESVTSFGCRLESLLQIAIDNGHIHSSAKNDMLRHKFWTSLTSDTLKAQTRHKYDTILDFNSLLREIRMVEKEINIGSDQNDKRKPSTQKSGVNVIAENSLEQRVGALEKSLKSELHQMEKRLEQKYESKLDKILTKLDSQPVNQASTSYSTGNPFTYRRGQGYRRGNHGNRGRRAPQQGAAPDQTPQNQNQAPKA